MDQKANTIKYKRIGIFDDQQKFQKENQSSQKPVAVAHNIFWM